MNNKSVKEWGTNSLLPDGNRYDIDRIQWKTNNDNIGLVPAVCDDLEENNQLYLGSVEYEK